MVSNDFTIPRKSSVQLRAWENNLDDRRKLNKRVGFLLEEICMTIERCMRKPCWVQGDDRYLDYR